MKSNTKILSGLLGLQFLLCQQVHSAGFQSQEQSAALFGVANAGTAVARDASIIFFNPAGMTQFEHPVLSVSGIWIDPIFAYEPIKATDFAGNPITGTSANPAQNALLPAAYYIQPINDHWFAGLAFEIPYGLSTYYDQDSLARYFATKSKIAAYTISPSIAYKINEKVSIGAALDIQYLTAELDQAFDFAAVSQFNQGDVFIQNKANDWSVGWNMGLYFQVTPAARLGLAYRSPISHIVKGSSRVSNVPSDFIGMTIAQALGLRDSDVSASLQLPETLTLSFLYDITPSWTTMADVQYTHWSNVDQLTLTFSGNPTGLSPNTHHLAPATVLLDYRDSVRVALGQEVKVNKHVLLRTGFAFDQTPARGSADLIRLPDGNRYWLTLGSGFRWKGGWALDLAYAHIFINDRTLTQSFDSGLGGGPTVFQARYADSQADLCGAQLSYQFG